MLKKQIYQNIREGAFKDIPLEPAHDRQVLCCDINSDVIVTGSADHGLRVYSTQSGQFHHELFGKKYGHKEWVTDVTILKDGRILSSGMEGLLCLWSKNKVQCDFLMGHETSISKIKIDEKNLAISSSYDCTIRLWNLNTTKYTAKNSTGILVGPHKKPILDFVHKNSLVISGDKNGVIGLWDINKQICVKDIHAHQGGVGKIKMINRLNDNFFISGGLKDGVVNLYDIRQEKLINKLQLCQGSINAIKQTQSDFLILGSSDKNITFLDFKMLTKKPEQLKMEEGIMSIQIVQDIAVCGLKDGNLMFIDCDLKNMLYGFGAMRKGSIVKTKFTEDFSSLIVAGDDPTSLLLKFNQFFRQYKIS